MRNFVKTVSALNISITVPAFIILVFIVLMTLFGYAFASSARHEIPVDFVIAFVIEGLIALWLIISVILSFTEALNINANCWSNSFTAVFINSLLCGALDIFVITNLISGKGHFLNMFTAIVGLIMILPLALLAHD